MSNRQTPYGGNAYPIVGNEQGMSWELFTPPWEMSIHAREMSIPTVEIVRFAKTPIVENDRKNLLTNHFRCAIDNEGEQMERQYDTYRSQEADD